MSTQPIPPNCEPRGEGASLECLLRFSAEVGNNPLLVQASSGNTSVKLGGTLWIKASGKWLAFAGRDEILVPVSLSKAWDCFAGGTPMVEAEVRDDRCGPAALRPSIETLMHAVLPHPVVVHVHSINTIAWAVRSDARSQLAGRLAGLRWQWIPYVPSGLALAQAVAEASNKDVFVLGNHGLVVCGNSCPEAESLLAEVETRLAIAPRPAPESKLRILDQVQRLTQWIIPNSDRIHSLALDSTSRKLARTGILYPCQAIFLGGKFPQFLCSQPLSDLKLEAFAASPFLAFEGGGVLLNPNITTAEYAILEGFSEVLARIDGGAPVRYLSTQETGAAMSADAVQYRSSSDNRPRKWSV